MSTMVTSRPRIGRANWPSLDAVERWVLMFFEDVASALPGRTLLRLFPPIGRIVLDVSIGGAIEARLPDGRHVGVESEADAAALRDAARTHPVAFAVPGEQILSTVLRVPRRATAQLDDLVKMHVPVWTPFPADALHFKARILSDPTPRSGGAHRPTCAVELRCVPKSTIEGWTSLLSARSVELDEIWLGPEDTFAVALASAKTEQSRRRRRVAFALFGLAAIQAVTIVGLLGLRLGDQIDRTEARLDSVRQAVHAKAARSERQRALAKSVAEVRARATGPDSMGHMMALLAKALPVGASYRDLSVSYENGGSLIIVSPTRIDPAAVVASTGIISVTEVNDMDGSQEDDHVYGVAFRFNRTDGVAR